VGANGAWILQKGVYERTATFQTHICVVLASLQYREKNKKHCLETSLNSTLILENIVRISARKSKLY
jgi:hypothetical protein